MQRNQVNLFLEASAADKVEIFKQQFHIADHYA